MKKGAVVVTGASTGIGRACAQLLSREGFTVFGTVRREEDGAGLDRPLLLDVTDAATVARAAGAVRDEVGDAGLAGLVNNAGIVVSAPLEAVPLDELRRQLEVNVVGLLRTTQTFLPLLRAGRGRLVNVSSTSGLYGFPLLGPYSASKFAVESMSDVLRLELAPWHIPVSVIEPGPVRTPIWEKGQRTGARIEEGLDPAVRALYEPLYRVSRSNAERASSGGLEPGAVARAVLHALTARRPRTRYLLGRSPLLLAVFRLLPDRWRDAVVLRRLGYPPAETSASSASSPSGRTQRL